MNTIEKISTVAALAAMGFIAACGRPATDRAAGPARAADSSGASVDPGPARRALDTARLRVLGADRANPFLPSAGASTASVEQPRLIGEGELLSLDRVLSLVSPSEAGGEADADDDGELAGPRDRFLVWDAGTDEGPIADATYSYEIRDAANRLVTQSPRLLAGIDERGPRWFIPLRALAPHGVSAADPADTVWLALELRLASGARLKSRIALRLRGDMPRLVIESAKAPATTWADGRALGVAARAQGVLLERESFTNPARRELALWARVPQGHLTLSTVVLFTDYAQGGVPAGQQDPVIVERVSRYQSSVAAEVSWLEISRQALDRKGGPVGQAETEVRRVPPGDAFAVAVGARQRITLSWYARPAQPRACALPPSVERVFNWPVSHNEIDGVGAIFSRPTIRHVVENRSASRTAAWSLGGAGAYGTWSRSLALTEKDEPAPGVLEAEEKRVHQDARSGGVDPALPQHACSGLF